MLAIHTGLRQGELLGLKWEDVDLESGTLRVRRTLATTKSGPMLTAPKTKGSRRSVKLTQGALDALRSHLKRQCRRWIGLAPCGARTAWCSPLRPGNRLTAIICPAAVSRRCSGERSCQR